MGRPTFSAWREMEKTQWYSPNELQELQIKKLRALLGHAASNVPYYCNLFKKLGFNPQAVHNLADLRQITLLSKQDIKRDLDWWIKYSIKENRLKAKLEGYGLAIKEVEELVNNLKRAVSNCGNLKVIQYEKEGGEEVTLWVGMERYVNVVLGLIEENIKSKLKEMKG